MSMTRFLAGWVLALLMVPAAHAVPFEGTALGSWVNPDGTFGYNIINLDAQSEAWVLWGEPENLNQFRNRIAFDGVGSSGGPGWSAEDGQAFRIGEFSFSNGLVGFDSHDLLGISLDILLQLTTPMAAALTFTFDFGLINTPNTGDPVLDADIVTVSNPGSPTTFSFEGLDYTLRLLGFSSDQGATILTDFVVPERETMQAGLYAQIDLVPAAVAIPEPGGLALLGIGLLGIAWMHRRRARDYTRAARVA